MRRSMKINLLLIGKLILCVAIGNMVVDILASIGKVNAQEGNPQKASSPQIQGESVTLSDNESDTRVARLPNAALPNTTNANSGSSVYEPVLELTPLLPKTVSPAVVTSHTTPQDCDTYLVPVPCLTPTMSLPELPISEEQVPWRDEVLIDGGDRNLRVQVNQDWQVLGLDTEDTIAHFDTLSGRRLIQPSNRVGIYAPRFKAVRKITQLVDAQSNTIMAQVEEKTSITQSRSTDFSTTTLQHLQPRRNRLAMSANSFRDQTRGVNVDNTVQLSEFENQFKLYEDLQTIRFGRYVAGEKARLSESIQRATSWASDLEVLSAVSDLRLIESKDVKVFETAVGIKNQVEKPALRLVKVANKMAAEVGEEVEFTLRFDNVGNQTIGNVTILDNLTGRLEYVPESGQCSIDGNLLTKVNSAESTQLRWEITNPLAVGEGGIIRFKCIVR